MQHATEGMLGPYRVLDLTDECGMLCGRILGDLGADVIKIEPPGGSPVRRIGPFHNDEVDTERSLPWLALNTGKRSACLDIEPSSPGIVEKSLQCRSLIGAATVASVDILVNDRPALTLTVAVQGCQLGIDRDTFGGLLLGADSHVDSHSLSLLAVHALIPPFPHWAIVPVWLAA